jgi:Tfp pilus assembly protein PilF
MGAVDRIPSRREEAFFFFCKAYEHQIAGELGAAIVNYKKSIEIHPTAEAHTFLGWTYGFLERFDQAIGECRRAIELDPELGNPYNDIGAYLIEKGCFDEAAEYLERALGAKRYETPYFAHYNLGRVWEGKGDRPRAIRSYRRALKENPDYRLARIALWKIGGFFN